MPSLNPFTSARNAIPLFEIRLENDFIVFRGTEHESSGQLLKGTVVLCLPAPMRVEDVHLRLTGTLHMGYGPRIVIWTPKSQKADAVHSWTDSKITATGVSNHRVDRTTTIFMHRWQPFAGIGSQQGSQDSPSSITPAHSKGETLPAGNHEWPFEVMLPGDTTESVEGLREANITYKLKATVARPLLYHDYHAYKRLRIIRTLESSALEFLHAMSVENIWPNKVEYSIVVPQKAVVFGSSIPLETRFTPLLKGLELGDVSVKLMETHDIILQSQTGHTLREHRKEKEVMSWTIPMTREEHWQDMIEDTGQEGWLMKTSLDLPKKLGSCIQDVNTKGIKVRHKLKMVVGLKNPDGHISELRATLPVAIFISPNMPLDDEGNLVRQIPQGTTAEVVTSIAPPGYGEHVLDQLYDEMEPTGLQTPPMNQSGMNSPMYSHSRAGSTENLASLLHGTAITPAALSSRLQNVSLEPAHRNHSWNSLNGAVMGGSGSGGTTPGHYDDTALGTPPHTAPLSRQTSDEQQSGSHTPEHVDYPDEDLEELSKVPSYQTAVKSPVRSLSYTELFTLPEYSPSVPALPTSAPGTPLAEDTPVADPLAMAGMAPIAESISQEQEDHTTTTSRHAHPPRRPAQARRRHGSLGFSFTQSFHHHSSSSDEQRRLQLMQARERVA
ncbi:hypothetical protein B0T17DRAFT_505729 [Bombardia bombarda]|uniref:Arrestin C-terminal-like domain-containing protein n=1 Tax=Bombardia bombarda TaxID=252184 RepID=A0AA39X8I5_9PEZI|nr:hypothetical protein B0T17DRAFT_505729 [Bombardia bombarda]